MIINQDYLKPTMQALSAGKVVAFPTETVYALACDAANKSAIHKLYHLKKRPLEQVFAILVRDVRVMEKYAELDDRVLKLLAKFSPGPLTYVLHAKKNTDLCEDVIKDGKIGIRIPDHEVAMNILKHYRVPLVATSVNFSGQPSALQVGDIDEALKNKIDLIIDGGKSHLEMGSTVVDLSAKDEIYILREGRISRDEITRSL